MRLLKLALAFSPLFLLLCVPLVQAESKIYRASMTPDPLTQWTDSDDKRLSICFTMNKTTYAADEPIIIRCAARNNSDSPMTILRPFGDSFYSLAEGLKILGPDGPITYYGPMKEYVLGTSAFHQLAPHSIIDETLEVPRDLFPGLGKVGPYKIGYLYYSSGYLKPAKPEDFWEGKIKTSPEVILIK